MKDVEQGLTRWDDSVWGTSADIVAGPDQYDSST
jgi:hypothetical protein